MKNILIQVSVHGLQRAVLGAVLIIVALAVSSEAAVAQSNKQEYDAWCRAQGGRVTSYDPPTCDSRGASGSGGSSSESSGSLSDGIIGQGVRAIFHLFRESDEARTRRLSESNKANDEGVQFYKNGEYAKALVAFQKAAKLDPDDTVIKKNIANARQAAANVEAHQAVANANAETEQRNLRLAREAAERMHRSVDKLAQSVTAAPTTNGGLDFDPGNAINSPSGGGGLDFVADIATAGKKRTGAFGGNESNPSLGAPLGRGEVGTNTNPGDQLGSIAKREKTLGSMYPEAASQTAREGFDTGVKERGSLSDVTVGNPTATMQMPVIPPGRADDKVIKEGLERYNKVLPDLEKAKEEVKRAQATSDGAKAPDAKVAALIALDGAKSKENGLKDAAKAAIKQVDVRMVYLDRLPVTPADGKPPADSNAPPLGSTPPGGGKKQ